MDQEPYEEWADRVCTFLDKYGLAGQPADSAASEQPESSADLDQAALPPALDEPAVSAALDEPAVSASLDQADDEKNIVVDLGCGTGKLTEILAQRGYDMIGIDLSEDMLAVAAQRREEYGSSTLYTQQDMRSFELYGAAGAMVSVGDSINYLLEEKDLEEMFRCVERGLLPGGLFVFDFKTVHLYRDSIGLRTIAENRSDCSFIWNNYYDADSCINEYDLTFYVSAPECGDDSLFRRFEEVHYQRAYEPQQLRRAAEAAGLLWITAQDADTGGEITPGTERVMAAARKAG